MFLGAATTTALLLAGCGNGSSAIRPADQWLAAEIAPTAADLGKEFRLAAALSGAQLRAACTPPATGCAVREFQPRGDKTSGVLAGVEMFATPSAARSAYEQAKRHYLGGVTVQLAIGPAQATTLRLRGKSNRKYVRWILIREGRALLILNARPARLLRFEATSRRLATLMRPALP